MLNFLPAPLLGLITAILYTLNLLICSVLVYLMVLLKLIPVKSWQKSFAKLPEQICFFWQDINDAITKLTAKIRWEVHGLEQLRSDEWYLLLANHQSWADILVLMHVFKRKIPGLKFFMKKQLLWTLPLAGFACWLLGFPFMERYSKEKIAKHPELKGKDLTTTKRSCARFKLIPSTMANFPEGTRFTPAKQQLQHSPYRHLLRPRAGGVAFTLATMGECLREVIDVTIVYLDNRITVWDFFCGKQHKIIIQIRVLPIPADLIGDYASDREFRIKFQSWFNQLWQRKDQIITSLKQQELIGATKPSQTDLSKGVKHAK